MSSAIVRRLALSTILLIAISTHGLAQFSVWIGPESGFYETSGNWSPSGQPTEEATFWRPGEFEVLFSGNESVRNLSLSNNTDVTFTPGNLNPTRRTYTVDEQTVVDNASLTLGGEGLATDLMSFSVGVWNEGNLNVTNGSRYETSGSTSIHDGSSLNFRGTDDSGTASSGATTHVSLRDGGTISLSDGARLQSQSITSASNSSVNVSGVDALGNPTTVRIQDGPFGQDSLLLETEINILHGGQFVADEVTMDENSNVTVMGVSDTGAASRLTTNRTLNVREGSVILSEGAEMVTQSAWIGNGRVLLGSDSRMPASWIASNDVVVTTHGSLYLRENTYASFTNLGINEGGRVQVFENAKLNADRMSVSEEFVFGNPYTDGLAGTFEVRTFEGDLANVNGVVAPGPGAGLTSVTGKYTQYSDANLSMEVGGLTGGSEFDVLNVGGHASLRGGDLELSLLDGYQPSGSDTFSILRAAIITGEFDNVAHGERLETLDGGGSFVVNYGVASPFDIDEVVLSDFLSLAGLTGDFNADGMLDAMDIDLLGGAVGGTDISFDLTADGLIDAADRTHWVKALKGTHFGDADLNHAVGVTDFLALSGKFGSNGGWADGDFDGNGTVNVADFLMLSQNFGQSSASAMAAATVPEPAASLLSLFCLVGLLASRRRR